jgi:hypothetical protein
MLDFACHAGTIMLAPMMAVVGTVNGFHIALAIHVATVIATFGVVFARPLVFAAANRQDQRSLPVLHRIEYTIERVLVVPGVLVVILTGAYLANREGRWSAFYVWWGIGVVALIGAALAIVMIPTAKRAEVVVARDLRAGAAGGADTAGTGDTAGAAGAAGTAGTAGTTGTVGLSGEYRSLTRRLAVVSAVLCVLVLITMLFMGLERPL